MKRFTNFILAALIVIAPLSASALEALTESNMKSLTGQAGVTIGVDDIVIYQEQVSDVTYRDTDGLTSGAGTIGISDAGIQIDYDDNTKKLITIDAILNDSVYGIAAMDTLFGTGTDVGLISSADAAAGYAAGTFDPMSGNIAGMTSGLKALSIDIGTCSVLSTGLDYNFGGAAPGDIAGVIIGLPTVEITQYFTNDVKNVRIVSSDAAALNAGKSFIQIEKTGYSKIAILGGVIEIAPH